MLALELHRSVAKYVAARTVGERIPGLIAGPLAPLRLVNREEPRPPSEGWARVRTRLSGPRGAPWRPVRRLTGCSRVPDG